MKNALLATVAALGLFAAGATFTSMNPAARPAAQVAASENTHDSNTQQFAAGRDHQRYDANAHFAASENTHDSNTQQFAEGREHQRYDANAHFAASENTHDSNTQQFAASENNHDDRNAHFA